MHRTTLLVLAVLLLGTAEGSGQSENRFIYAGTDGRLVYLADARGNRIPTSRTPATAAGQSFRKRRCGLWFRRALEYRPRSTLFRNSPVTQMGFAVRSYCSPVDMKSATNSG